MKVLLRLGVMAMLLLAVGTDAGGQTQFSVCDSEKPREAVIWAQKFRQGSGTGFGAASDIVPAHGHDSQAIMVYPAPVFLHEISWVYEVTVGRECTMELFVEYATAASRIVEVRLLLFPEPPKPGTADPTTLIGSFGTPTGGWGTKEMREQLVGSIKLTPNAINQLIFRTQQATGIPHLKRIIFRPKL